MSVRGSLVATAAIVGGLAAGYAAIVRPRITRWGATDGEVQRALPGDDLTSRYGYRPISTRAITIDAPPEDVWPWLVQMGSGRAGFYTHERVERLLFITYADGHSATRIHPEWQELHVGDRVPWPLLWPVAALVERGPGELLHHYMESGMLLGIKARVEASRPTPHASADAAR
jgi:hypothetical protein